VTLFGTVVGQNGLSCLYCIKNTLYLQPEAVDFNLVRRLPDDIYTTPKKSSKRKTTKTGEIKVKAGGTKASKAPMLKNVRDEVDLSKNASTVEADQTATVRFQSYTKQNLFGHHPSILLKILLQIEAVLKKL